MTFEIELKIRFNGDYVFNREKGIITIENDKIIGNVEKELDEIEIIDTESIEEKLSFIVYGTIVCC